MTPAAVIFLDFDGVLHKDGGPHFEHSEQLASVLDEHPGVGIVFSTSWQFQESTDELRRYLPERIRDRVLGGTADDAAQDFMDRRTISWMKQISRTPGGVNFYDRESLAEGWMQAYSRSGVPWLSLDDDGFRFGYRSGRLLLCRHGFHDAEEVLLRAWLAAPERNIQDVVLEHAPTDPTEWTEREAVAAVRYQGGVPVLEGLPEPLRDAALRLMPDVTAGHWESLISKWGCARRGPRLMVEDGVKRRWLP